MSALYPSPSKADLAEFVGRPLGALPTPCAVLHAPTLRANCARLVTASRALGIRFRPHVKTHKARRPRLW